MKRSLLALLVLTVASIARGESVTLGPATFDVPAGWKVAKKSAANVTLESPDAEPGDRGNIVLIVTATPAARLDAAFAEFANGITQKHYKPDRVDKARTADGFAARQVACEYDVTAKGKSFDVATEIVGVQSTTHLACAALVTFGTVAQYTHDDAFEAMVRSMRMTGASALPATRPTEVDVSGFFGKFGITIMPSPLGGTSLQQTRDYLYFLPGGFVYRDVPPADLIDKPDAAELRKRSPIDCGTYAIHGDRITMTEADVYGFLTDETHLWKGVTKDGVDVGGLYNPLLASKNRRLDGTYRSSFYLGGDGSTGTSGGVSNERFLTFRPDGTYEQRGVTSMSMTVEGGGGDSRTGIAGSSKRPTVVGTYALDGYTLTLTPKPAGATQRFSAYLTDDDAGMIVLDDDPYLKPDKK